MQVIGSANDLLDRRALIVPLNNRWRIRSGFAEDDSIVGLDSFDASEIGLRAIERRYRLLRVLAIFLAIFRGRAERRGKLHVNPENDQYANMRRTDKGHKERAINARVY